MNDKVPSSYIELTAGIVSAYVSNNAVAAGDISSLISQVHNALLRISNGQSEAAQRHNVDSLPEQSQDSERGKDRERD